MNHLFVQPNSRAANLIVLIRNSLIAAFHQEPKENRRQHLDLLAAFNTFAEPVSLFWIEKQGYKAEENAGELAAQLIKGEISLASIGSQYHKKDVEHGQG